MRVKQRAKQRGVELPLIISDHSDWDELTQTIRDTWRQRTCGSPTAAKRRWRAGAELNGYAAKPLALVGYEDEGD
jgi:putative mRNA 3-end processing factor